MVTKAYKMMMAAILVYFSIFEILTKIERYYRLWIGNAKYWKENEKLRLFFNFEKKNLQEFYKNPTFVLYVMTSFN